MTNEEIISELKEEITLLYNCTDDTEMKGKLKRLLSGWVTVLCTCPKCGEKFSPEQNSKFSEKIL